jgi:hypothetical protein
MALDKFSARVLKMEVEAVQKFNPNHDAEGKFADAPGGSGSGDSKPAPKEHPANLLYPDREKFSQAGADAEGANTAKAHKAAAKYHAAQFKKWHKAGEGELAFAHSDAETAHREAADHAGTAGFSTFSSHARSLSGAVHSTHFGNSRRVGVVGFY